MENSLTCCIDKFIDIPALLWRDYSKAFGDLY